ncbi:MAG: hypothetical protein RMM17_07105 [Acidobacteriota bacterium]|nr:hypothetical protein [Blastocatellia bacterium]MDW8412432.1 hypothetical protein [Acidobacteriota bacterium]
MFCPNCGVENERADYCRKCNTNLALVSKFIRSNDSVLQRSRLLTRTGLVGIVISEGVAWTLAALLLFVVLILTGTVLLPREPSTTRDIVYASVILVLLILLCGVPLLLGLVLILKDLTYTPKSPNARGLQNKPE